MSQYSTTILADRPIRYYRLGEPTGATVAVDLGSQGQNGTIHAGVTCSQSGLIAGDPDTCMLFSTAGYIDAPTTGLPTGAARWSVECWLSMPSLGASFQSVIEFGNPATNQAVALFVNSSHQVAVNTYGGNEIDSGAPLVANTTYYVVATYDGTNLRLYVNGAPQGSPLPCTPAIALTYCYISRESTGFGFNGLLDEVAIYADALSPYQITQHYQAGLKALRTTYWSGVGMNYGHQNFDPLQTIRDFDFLWQLGVRAIRIFAPAYVNAAGIANTQYMAQVALAKGFYVLWGLTTGVDSGLTATQWTAYKAAVTGSAAAWAQSVGLSELSMGNEFEGEVDGTTLTQATLQSDILSMATTVKSGGYTGKVSYSCGTAFISSWNTLGIGSLDYIAFNPYDSLNNFVGNIATIVADFGADHSEVTEFGWVTNGMSDWNGDEKAFWMDVSARIDALINAGIKRAYFFTLRDGGALNQDTFALIPARGVPYLGSLAVLGSASIPWFGSTDKRWHRPQYVMRAFGGPIVTPSPNVPLPAWVGRPLGGTFIRPTATVTIPQYAGRVLGATLVHLIPPTLGVAYTGSGTLTASMSVSVPLAFESDGSGTLGGTPSAAAALVGALVSTGTLVGTLALSAALSGMLSATGQLSGTPSYATQLFVSLDGIVTLAGTLQAGGVTLSVTVDAGGTLAAMLSVTTFTPRALSALLMETTTNAFIGGICTGAGNLAGTLSATTSLIGTLPGVSTSTSSLMLTTGLTTALAGSSTLAGPLSGTLSLASTPIAGAGTLTGTAQFGTGLAGTLAGSASVIFLLSAQIPLGGALAGTGVLSLALAVNSDVTGVLTGVGTLAGTLSGGGALAASLAGSSTLTGMLSASVPLGSILPGIGTLASDIALLTLLAVPIGGSSTFSGTLLASFPLSTTLAGAGAIAGAGSLATVLVNTCAGAGALTVAPVVLTTALAQNLGGMGILSGIISGGGALSVVAAGVGTLAGTLSAQVALTRTLAAAGSMTATPSLGVSWTGMLAAAGTLSGTSVLMTSLFVIVPGASNLGGVMTRTVMMAVVSTGSGQLSAALILGGGQFAMCLFIGRGMLAGVFSFPGQSVTATWQTRDLSTTWKTRDLAATWKTRDLEDTWKARR